MYVDVLTMQEVSVVVSVRDAVFYPMVSQGTQAQNRYLKLINRIGIWHVSRQYYLPRPLPNYKEVWVIKHPNSRVGDFANSVDKMYCRIL